MEKEDRFDLEDFCIIKTLPTPLNLMKFWKEYYGFNNMEPTLGHVKCKDSYITLFNHNIFQELYQIKNNAYTSHK